MVITKFSGIVNTVSERDIPEGALQDAVNVDITNAGGIIARPGYQLAVEVPISTAYTTLDEITYIVSSGRLKRVNTDLSLTDICATTATEFTDYQRYLFTNDGVSVFNETITDLVVPTPLPPDVVITAGVRPAGMYHIVTTFINSSGLEGGTSPIVTIELGAPGELLITPDQRDGYTSAVYITDVDGEVFYDIRTGRQIFPAQINANPFPANADKIEYFQSRLYVSERMGDHTVVWFSHPNQFHLYGVDDGYFVIPGTVRGMKGTDQALIIGTDAAIYAYADGSITELAKYGVVAGRPMVKDSDGMVYIHSEIGLYKALPFQELGVDLVSLPMGTKCSANIMYHKGIHKYVGLHDGGGEAFNKF